MIAARSFRGSRGIGIVDVKNPASRPGFLR